MDEALPKPVRLRLHQALEQWSRWSGGPARRPDPICQLAGGGHNTSVKVGDGERHWVLRLDGFNPASLGISRSVEWRALQQAAAVDLAPRPVYQNPDLGVLVCEYAEPDEDAIDSIATVALLLRRIHALPTIKYRLDPMQRGRRYADLAGIEELPGDMVEALERLQQSPADQALCHNDLLAANRLCSDGRLLALDWEYAATGDPLFDLAAVIEGDNLTDEEAEVLLQAWLDRDPDDEELQRVQDQRVVYRSLGALWEEAVAALQQ